MNIRTTTYKSRSMNVCEQQQTIGSFIQNAFPPKLMTFTHTKDEDLARFYKIYVQTSRIMRIFIDTFIAQCADSRKKRPWLMPRGGSFCTT